MEPVIKSLDDIIAILRSDASDSTKVSITGAMVESLRQALSSASAPVYAEAPKPVPMAAAAGGGGGDFHEAPPKPASYTGAASKAKHIPHPHVERKIVRKTERVGGVPAHWPDNVKAALKTVLKGKNITKEQLMGVWNFLKRVFPSKTFPTEESYTTTLVYGEKCDFYYKATNAYYALHNFLQSKHDEECIRAFFNSAYDEEGKFLLLIDEEMDEVSSSEE